MTNALLQSLPRETRMQIALLEYISYQYKDVVVVHIPNDMARTKTEGYVKKCMGMLPGFPDLMLLKKERTLFLELKTKEGKLSQSQIDTQEALKELGFEVKTSFGITQALKIVDKFALAK